MPRNNVTKLYGIAGARWYNFFKNIWNKVVVSKAQAELVLFLKNNLTEDKTVLDLGCGTALNLKTILDQGLKFKSYLGLDFSPDMLRIAEKNFSNIPNVKFQEKDITKLDDISEKFDIIISTWVLSHLENPEQVVSRVQELLAEKGKFFIICFTIPKWYIGFWLYPLAKYFFQSSGVPAKTIEKFKNVKSIKGSSANIATVIEIDR